MAPAVVFLVGFMGAGKTTVGRELASRLGSRFIDLDDRIVARERRSVAEIFSKFGEAGFRRAESRALHELLRELTREPALVALGGGAWSQPQNRLRLQDFGAPVVFLDAPLDVLRERCAPEASLRPLFADAERFRELYEARRKDYALAGLRIDTAGKSPAQVAGEVIASLQWVPTSASGEPS